ncbi:hypothetical protein WN55_08406 [Dufourea novaeangliae]|uniref:Uncharacterized protein n=1 Tax=Dufourea novaeangliae TaxID=178035 RepID=A0A154P8F9_DUFNO|nr:hypothetical protein WN55_08406 [Dufourea novaeangliae]
MGGADTPDGAKRNLSVTAERSEQAASAAIQEQDAPNLQPEKHERPPVTTGPCCSCIGQVPGAIGDKNVEEMIDYVHRNLEEAGKALATLSENFEHDSKVEPCTQVEPS